MMIVTKTDYLFGCDMLFLFICRKLFVGGLHWETTTG